VSEPPHHELSEVALVILAGVVCLGALLWGAGVASAVLADRRVPTGHDLAGFAACADVASPARAWGAPVGPAVQYWAITAVALALGTALGVARWRFLRPGGLGRSLTAETLPETASAREIRRAAGRRALLARSATLRRSLRHPRPSDVGYRLGRSRGVECWASIEDSMLVLGPPRAGKGLHLVVPMILDAPGALVTTSTRPDNLAVTLPTRAQRGPVMVFDPEGLTGRPTPGRLRWSLSRGCEEPQRAMLRAEALLGEASRSGVENATFWRTQAASVVRCLLHAAALDARPAAELFRWSHSAGQAKETIAILSSHPGATPGWARALDATVSADPRTRDSVWAMVANTFAPLADPAVLDALSPEDDEAFDPLAFLALRGSVYLLGTATGASATASLDAALIEDLLDAARRLAARSPGQRLDPPLALVLDEAANYPLPSLASLVSEGGGSGITTVVVLQSLAQARERFGREAAQAIWDSAIVKVVLGGSANADDLSDISRLAGERAVTEWSETHGTARFRSSQVRGRAVLEPAALRRLEFGKALLLLWSASSIILELSPWTARRNAKALRVARERFEEGIVA
jgi:type IV secretion system protein VirD4